YGEVKMAQLALTRSTDTGVKKMATMLENDHNKIIKDLKGYAAKNGIVTNEYVDRRKDSLVYCVADSLMGRSPKNMLVPTLGELMKKRNPEAKVYGLSLKDRAAILMTGNNADCALWLDTKQGGLGTSKYYKIPTWLAAFNAKNQPSSAQGRVWEAIGSIYKPPTPDEMNKRMKENNGQMVPLPRPTPSQLLSLHDDAEWEGKFPAGGRAFPHKIPSAREPEFWEAYVKSPFSIDWLFDGAKACIENADLGKDTTTDMLCIGVSTTDEIGHLFGPNSREMKEIIIASDRILSGFLTYLDRTVGDGNYVVVVSSDHGVADVPERLRVMGQNPAERSAGRIKERDAVRAIESHYSQTFVNSATLNNVPALNMDGTVAQSSQSQSATENDMFVRHIEPPSIFIDTTQFTKVKWNVNAQLDTICAVLKRVPGIGIALKTKDVIAGKKPADMDKDIFSYIRNSVYAQRTGDILFYPSINWIIGSKTTTHGTPYMYDRHVPLFFMGGDIEPSAIMD
ncbi:MAG: alkaline phosphatase family protein, partial [Candidatus Kapabacteria bacterium]|nr:alkaline phosphatase family protein [Candidatus Kapabacteria bacterium]